MHSRRVPKWHPDHPDNLRADDDPFDEESLIDDEPGLGFKLLALAVALLSAALAIGALVTLGLLLYWVCHIILTRI